MLGPALRTFIRLLSYLKPYRTAFFLGTILSFFVALANGLTLTAFVPMFEAMDNDSEVYLTQFSSRERTLLAKGFQSYFKNKPSFPESALSEQKMITSEFADSLLAHAAKAELSPLSPLENLEMQSILFAKLRLNAAALPPLRVVIVAALAALPVYAIKILLLLICIRFIAGSGYKAIRDMRDELYSKVQELPLGWFYKQKSGELVSRLGNDVENIAAVISSNMRDSITNVFYILVHVILLAYFNAELLLFSLVSLPLILSPITLFTRKIRKSTKRSQNLLAEMHAHVQESLAAMKVIRFAGTEKQERKTFQRINERLYWRRFKETFYNNISPHLVELNSILVTLAILTLGAFFLDARNFTSAEFLVFVMILLFVIRPVIQLSGMYAKAQGAIAAASRVFEIIDMTVAEIRPLSILPMSPLKKSITFEGITFSYPGMPKPALDEIHLEVTAGSTVALVGESGGGKSTLMDLLARFYRLDAQEGNHGRILFDANNIENFDIKEHRSRMSIVTQDIFLFYGTIFSNIAYGNPNYMSRDIERAARLAHAHDFISKLPDGYHTMVGNRGLDLSGGQRQRIAIARALLRNPQLLILDEATSALDAKSEALVQHALERLFRNRTTFVIAHRLSTIENADKIVVMAKGKILEEGTHKSLMRHDGYYTYLYNLHQQGMNVS